MGTRIIKHRILYRCKTSLILCLFCPHHPNPDDSFVLRNRLGNLEIQRTRSVCAEYAKVNYSIQADGLPISLFVSEINTLLLIPQCFIDLQEQHIMCCSLSNYLKFAVKLFMFPFVQNLAEPSVAYRQLILCYWFTAMTESINDRLITIASSFTFSLLPRVVFYFMKTS